MIAWRGAWETPENTALTAAARQELDAAKREEMYLTLQKNLQQDSPFVFMFQQVAQAALAFERLGLHFGAELRSGVLPRRGQELTVVCREALPAGYFSSSSSAFASFRSAVSKPSVNQP